MARPALRRVARPEEADRPRLAHLDRDRSLVEAARRDPARFDALYRKYLAQVYSFAVYELARPSRGGGRHGADVPVALAGLRRLRGARPARRTARRRPRSGSGCSRSPATSSPSAAAAGAADPQAAARRRRRTPPTRPTSRGRSIVRDEAAGGAGAPSTRLTGDRRRAVVLRFVHEMTTAEIAAILGRSEGAVRVLIHRGPAIASPATWRRIGTAGDRRLDAARDGEIEALVVDRYLDSLLAAPTGRDRPTSRRSSTRPPRRLAGRRCRASTRRSGSRRPWPRVWPRSPAACAAGERGSPAERRCRHPADAARDAGRGAATVAHGRPFAARRSSAAC